MFGSPTRNHITIIFERLGVVFFTLILVLSGNISNSLTRVADPAFWRDLFSEASTLNDTVVVLGGLGLVLIVAVVLFVSFLFWLKTFFYIDGQNFIYERKTMFKKYSKLPIANIATINIQRSVFERFVGTSKVKLDLNSSHTANRTDFSFVLRQNDAEALRNTLYTLKSAQGSNTSQANLTDSHEHSARQAVISFSNMEVIRHKLLSLSLWQAFIGIFVIFVSPYLDPQNAWDFQSALRVALFAFAGGGAVMIWGILNLSGYTVERDNKNIFIQCGLIKKTSYTFESQKIHAVFVKQPVLARIFGLYAIEVAVVGLGNEKAETPQLCLLVNKSQAEKVLLQCAADFECESATIPSHKAAIIPAAVQGVVLSVAVFLFLTFSQFPYAFVLSAAIFGFTALGGWLSYKTKSIAYDERVFHYSKGIFSKRKVMFKYSNIQDTRIKTNFLLKRLNAGRMSLNILSGSKMKAHQTGYFELPHFETVSNHVVEHEDSSTGLLG